MRFGKNENPNIKKMKNEKWENGILKKKQKNEKLKMLDFRPLESRNRPRDCGFRNLREKVYWIPKFSSKSVPWGPVSWPSKDFGPDRS